MKYPGVWRGFLLWFTVTVVGLMSLLPPVARGVEVPKGEAAVSKNAEAIERCRKAKRTAAKKLAELEEKSQPIAEEAAATIESYQAQQETLRNLLSAAYTGGRYTLVSSLLDSENLGEFFGRSRDISRFTELQSQMIERSMGLMRDALGKQEQWKVSMIAQQEQVELVEQACADLKKGRKASPEEEAMIEELVGTAPEENEIRLKPWNTGKWNFPYEEFTVLPSPGVMNSGFGMRRNPGGGGARMHHGLDFAGRLPIYSPGHGVVVGAFTINGYGILLVIYHGERNGRSIFTRYGHSYMKDILVGPGQRVRPGQKISTSGNLGDATGMHLHFEVCSSARAPKEGRRNSTVCSKADLVDPMKWLPSPSRR